MMGAAMMGATMIDNFQLGVIFMVAAMRRPNMHHAATDPII